MNILASLKFVAQMISGAGIKECEHFNEIKVREAGVATCDDCVAEGAKWVHVRMCLTCGYVGCCDTSRRAHMRDHAKETGHPLARSIESKESWVWCYPHDRLVSRRI